MATRFTTSAASGARELNLASLSARLEARSQARSTGSTGRDMIGPMPQPTLQTERITLVPLADEHLEWEVELDSDPEVMRYLSGRASTREEVEASHARRMSAAQKVEGLGFWVGLVDDAFVGWWILQPAHGPDQPKDPGVADLGFRLLQRYWRQGLASEGARS